MFNTPQYDRKTCIVGRAGCRWGYLSKCVYSLRGGDHAARDTGLYQLAVVSAGAQAFRQVHNCRGFGDNATADRCGGSTGALDACPLTGQCSLPITRIHQIDRY